jgi:hypothetical protein
MEPHKLTILKVTASTELRVDAKEYDNKWISGKEGSRWRSLREAEEATSAADALGVDEHVHRVS